MPRLSFLPKFYLAITNLFDIKVKEVQKMEKGFLDVIMVIGAMFGLVIAGSLIQKLHNNDTKSDDLTAFLIVVLIAFGFVTITWEVFEIRHGKRAQTQHIEVVAQSPRPLSLYPVS